MARLAKENGVRVIVNTAPYQPVTDDFLKGCYLVTPNEVEAEELTGVHVDSLESADRAARVFLDKGVKNVVIMDGRVPHSILMELLTNEGAGTWLRRDEA